MLYVNAIFLGKKVRYNFNYDAIRLPSLLVRGRARAASGISSEYLRIYNKPVE